MKKQGKPEVKKTVTRNSAAVSKKETTAEKESSPKVKLVGIEELAKLVGVDERRIRQLEQEGVIKSESKTNNKEKREYKFAETIVAIVRYYRGKADSRRSGDSKEMEEEKLRQLAAKRELEEMKVLRARGELHHTDDIKRIFGAIFSRVHTGFESFPLGLAPKIAGKNNVMEIAGEIKTQLDKILYEITEYDIETLKTNVGAEYLAGLDDEEETEDES